MILPVLLDLPSREHAREAARQELANHRYRAAEPPWYLRLLSWIGDRLADLLDRATGAVPGGRWGLVVLSAILALLVAVVVVRLRPSARTGAVRGVFGFGAELTAQEHRALAERAAADGRWADAVRERLRAVVRELEERGILEPRPGRTADEVAHQAGSVVRDLAPALADAARVFDEVWYGGRVADAAGYALLVDVDQRVTAARLAPV